MDSGKWACDFDRSILRNTLGDPTDRLRSLIRGSCRLTKLLIEDFQCINDVVDRLSDFVDQNRFIRRTGLGFVSHYATFLIFTTDFGFMPQIRVNLDSEYFVQASLAPIVPPGPTKGRSGYLAIAGALRMIFAPFRFR